MSASRPSSTSVIERESALSLFLRGLFWAAMIALLLIAWSPSDIPDFSFSQLAWWRNKGPRIRQVVLLPTPTTVPALRVGIISGHWGSDAGATCKNGVTEAEVNHNIALRVQADLQKAGYQVDLLEEFDPRLENYKAAALVSIHADVCDYLGPSYTGFKTATAKGTEDPAQLENSLHLKYCLDARYQAATGLPYHAQSVSRHMTNYHVFREIAPTTPAVIIETGFLGLDGDLLINHPDIVAKGIADGILCYLRNEPVSTPTPGITPEATP